MYLLIGGDSELGAATFRHLKQGGADVHATTRRLSVVSLKRPFFDILRPLDHWKPPAGTEAACIFVAVARLSACAADPTSSASVNVSQTLRLVDRLTAAGAYVLYLSSNQVFDGEIANVPADAPACPVSEYGRQKAATEATLRERMARGAPIGILRLSKVVSPDMALIQHWVDALSDGKRVNAFNDMTLAPVPADLASAAIASLMKERLAGVFQLTGPRDVTYAEMARHLASELGVSAKLVDPISAISSGMPAGACPRHTTLDSSVIRERYNIIVPDVWDVLTPLLECPKGKSIASDGGAAKIIALHDLSQVAEGVYYSRYSMPIVDQEIIEFLKQAAATNRLRRARFCAHSSPDAEQHDMLIVSHRDTYVTPHRHLTKSETFVVLEGSAEIILFDESGAVEKTIKMGPPASGRPFFYRMPPRQFHSLAIESELLVFLENTKGPFTLDDREHASWAPNYEDSENGKAYIASIVRKA